MANYDFLVLQPGEFEELSRDLLQNHLGVFVESFTTGRDGGIDLRCARDSQKKTIIQAKRYKEWNELKSVLKKEVEKVGKLNPDRYILSTSVGLTPGNKDEILAMFSPYIKETADILGKDDLNNLIGEHEDVEARHYKLWLSSTNVMKRIIHKDAINWNEMELENIRHRISIFVENESMARARRILKDHKYVIISGIPGIGKTTLACMLAYDHLAHGYEQFISLSRDFNNAFKLYDRTRKQVFYFDDFLGSNIFEPERGFDREFLTFLETIRRNENAILILTTREYILADARCHYEKFKTANVEIAKCVLDIGSYTKPIRAKILYNHMANAGLPSEYIDEFLKDKLYHRIINHHNYNPRVIETYIDNGQWRGVKPEEFMRRFIDFFNNPYMVWEMSFLKLPRECQYALLVLATLDPLTSLKGWRKAYDKFSEGTHGSLGLKTDDFSWENALNLLQDCFIKIDREEYNPIFSVYPQTERQIYMASLFNPSVRDFLMNHLSKMPGIQKDLIENAVYASQLLHYREDAGVDVRLHAVGEIAMDAENRDVMTSRFKAIWTQERLDSASLLRINGRVVAGGFNKLFFLNRFRTSLPEIFKELKREMNDEFIVFLADNFKTHFEESIKLLPTLDWNDRQPALNELLEHMKIAIDDIEDYPDFIKILKGMGQTCLLYTSPSPRDRTRSRMPSSA